MYTPTQPLYNSRTYACFITTPNPPTGCFPSGWAAGCRQVTLVDNPANINFGTINSLTQSYCNNNADPTNFAVLPSGGTGNFTYQWYYMVGQDSCPSGTSTVGWSIAPNGTGSTYAYGLNPPGSADGYIVACFVTDASPGCGAQWAAGCQKLYTPGSINYPTLEIASIQHCYGGIPDPISLTFNPYSFDEDFFTYQWYYTNSFSEILCDNNLTITNDFVLVPGATSSTYYPPANATSGYYRCYVTPQTCSLGQFAQGCCHLYYNSGDALPYRGRIASGDENICPGGDPGPVFFSYLPATMADTTDFDVLPARYKWYYKDGINTCPTGQSTLGWTPVTTADSSFYAHNPPLGLTQNRTYACQTAMVTTYSTACEGFEWAANCRKVYVTGLNTVNYGTVLNNNETFCLLVDSNNVNPQQITFSSLPSNAGQFNYQWYYQDTIVAAPTGNNTTGWTLIENANLATYDPPAVLGHARTYACFVSPTPYSNCPPAAAWANGCSYVKFANTPVNFGTTPTITDSIWCTNNIQAQLSFTQLPSGGTGGFTYQWYYINGLVSAPTGSSTAGWTVLSGANTASYNVIGPVNNSRTYACFVSPVPTIIGCATSGQWAAGCHKVPVSNYYPVVTFGTMAQGDETICAGGGIPQVVSLATLPTGGQSYKYKWYMGAMLQPYALQQAQPCYGAA
ncbi:MAG: hypothetical protein M0D57_08665 [Sphingobacteriales bacterium JAD_PAG50586_3]|nr:MAG: hypothetical protein M0D57_08665 [Sphingobacteriales bacterium JAD_PAG50586_3]